MVLRDAQKSDTGNYTCMVSNTHGDDQITYYLLVQGRYNINLYIFVNIFEKIIFAFYNCGIFSYSDILITVPPSPPTIHATTSGSSSLSVTWRGGDDGGAPVLGLTLSYKKEYGGWKEETVPASHSSHVLQGLSCGTRYQIFVTAYNKVCYKVKLALS